MASAAGVIGSKGSAAGGGLGSCGVSCSLNGMYLILATGLSLKVMALSAGASETKSTPVSHSELSGGPEITEFSWLFASFSPSLPERTEFSLETAFCCRNLSEM